jgi:hypothetical protein
MCSLWRDRLFVQTIFPPSLKFKSSVAGALQLPFGRSRNNATEPVTLFDD